jgi:hypothetical protein
MRPAIAFSERDDFLEVVPSFADQRRPYNLRPGLAKLEIPSQICPVAIVLRSPYGN